MTKQEEIIQKIKNLNAEKEFSYSNDYDGDYVEGLFDIMVKDGLLSKVKWKPHDLLTFDNYVTITTCTDPASALPELFDLLEFNEEAEFFWLSGTTNKLVSKKYGLTIVVYDGARHNNGARLHITFSDEDRMKENTETFGLDVIMGNKDGKYNEYYGVFSNNELAKDWADYGQEIDVLIKDIEYALHLIKNRKDWFDECVEFEETPPPKNLFIKNEDD